MCRVRLLIEGRVQGVGFRYHTVARARELGLCGWVRNCPDGRVETEFEGPETAVAEMESWCRNGPITARVRAVTVVLREESTGGRHGGFSLRS